jgi:SOS-response transcriptional repressor LexA
MISRQQRTILDFVAGFTEARQQLPTVREIQQGCGISSMSVVSYNFDRLEDGEYVSRRRSAGGDCLGHVIELVGVGRPALISPEDPRIPRRVSGWTSLS